MIRVIKDFVISDYHIKTLRDVAKKLEEVQQDGCALAITATCDAVEDHPLANE